MITKKQLFEIKKAESEIFKLKMIIAAIENKNSLSHCGIYEDYYIKLFKKNKDTFNKEWSHNEVDDFPEFKLNYVIDLIKEKISIYESVLKKYITEED